MAKYKEGDFIIDTIANRLWKVLRVTGIDYILKEIKVKSNELRVSQDWVDSSSYLVTSDMIKILFDKE
jgi:hypothetical protein